MPFIFSYLLKLSLSLSVVYLFYRFVLRKLTFYNWNRFYLLCYAAASFFIPFINVTSVLEQNAMMNNKVVQLIPRVGAINAHQTYARSYITHYWSTWDFILLIVFAGVIIMLIRLMVQLLSFRNIMNKAQLLSEDDVKLYQVNGSIIPFSFGNSIFINRQLHNDKELQEIIRHEFVHVQQKHTMDIILAEFLCIFNWYNPFVWMMRKAIRQNLEFIADNKVLQTGFDKKQYQYLLLKVTGNNHFSIASQFNFSSLKKRIAMMNKMKSARAHLIKFLFVLPLMAVLLVAFRNNEKVKGREITSIIANEKLTAAKENKIYVNSINDTVPDEVLINSKGYFVGLSGEKENRIVIVKDKDRKEVKRLLLTEWYKKSNYYQSLYGPLPPKDESVATVNADEKPDDFNIEDRAAVKDFKKLELNDDLLATVTLNNAKIEKYDLNKEEDKKAFEKKYGQVISAKPNKKNKPVTIIKSSQSYSSDAVVVLPPPPSKKNADITTSVDSAPVTASSAVEVIDEFVEPVSPVKDFDNVNGELVLDIRGNMPESKVKEMVATLKSKGYVLVISALEYHNGKIALLKGSISTGDRKNNFEASDFLRFAISDVRKDDGKKEFNFYVGSGSLTWQ